MSVSSSLTLYCVEAHRGDCFVFSWIHEGIQQCLVVDCGPEWTYPKLYPIIERLGRLTAIIITHVDYDHLGGLISFMNDDNPPCKLDFPIYMNTPSYALAYDNSEQVNIEHGIDMDSLLKSKKLPVYGLFAANGPLKTTEIGGMKLTILSPTEDVLREFVAEWNAFLIKQESEEREVVGDEKTSKGQSSRPIEDYFNKSEGFHKVKDDLINASSIAFIAEYGNSKYLMLGDSHPEVVEKVLRNAGYNESYKLSVDYVKVSHHGSKFNTSRSLLSIIDCKKFIISTNGAGNYYHPDKETIAKLIQGGAASATPILIYTNYDLGDHVLTEKECTIHNVSVFAVNQLP